MTKLEKNHLSTLIGLKDFNELKILLRADSQLSQLVSPDDVLNSINFIFTLEQFKEKICKCKK